MSYRLEGTSGDYLIQPPVLLKDLVGLYYELSSHTCSLWVWYARFRTVFTCALLEHYRLFPFLPPPPPVQFRCKEKGQELRRKVAHERNTLLICALWSYQFDLNMLKTEGRREFELKLRSKRVLHTAEDISVYSLNEVLMVVIHVFSVLWPSWVI